MPKKKKSNALDDLGKVAIGMGGLGVGLGVSGAVVGRVATQAPQVAPLSQGISDIAGFAPIAGTAMSGGIVLREVKKLNKNKFKYKDKNKIFGRK